MLTEAEDSMMKVPGVICYNLTGVRNCYLLQNAIKYGMKMLDVI